MTSSADPSHGKEVHRLASPCPEDAAMHVYYIYVIYSDSVQNGKSNMQKNDLLTMYSEKNLSNIFLGGCDPTEKDSSNWIISPNRDFSKYK